MSSALILIDIQNDYFDNGSNTLSGSLKACENARMILDDFRLKGFPVVHIKHIATKPTATFFLPDTVGAELHEKVKPLAHEKVFIKHYPNSFRETDLHNYLKSLDVSHLVLCGMMTHMCVDATTRAAKDLGFECTVIGDACATKDLEINGRTVKAMDVQDSFLAALSYFYSTIRTTKNYLHND